jgi:uncharacterized membrane-anchored protein YjiN (DUF445 family)
MEELFRKHPLMIGLFIGGFLIVAWFTSSFWLGLIGAVVGAFFGANLDKD